MTKKTKGCRETMDCRFLRIKVDQSLKKLKSYVLGEQVKNNNHPV